MTTLCAVLASSESAACNFFVAGAAAEWPSSRKLLCYSELPTAVGQIVTLYGNTVIRHNLAGERHLEFATIGDILAHNGTTSNGAQPYSVQTLHAPAEEMPGYRFKDGVTIEEMTCIGDCAFSAASVKVHCKSLQVDCIGVVVGLVRSVGEVEKQYTPGVYTVIGVAGNVVSVDVVFLGIRNGAVEIVEPRRACCCVM